MPCCHVDFALTEKSDPAFTIGMPTFTFGAGCLSETGEQARALDLARVALCATRLMWRLRGPRSRRPVSMR